MGYVQKQGTYEHRLVMSEMLGRELKKEEEVHHKDHDKKNNDPSNLKILTKSEHGKLHREEQIELGIKTSWVEIDREELQELLSLNKQFKEIALLYGCTEKTVSRKAKAFVLNKKSLLKARILRMRKEGMKFREIADFYNITLRSVFGWVK